MENNINLVNFFSNFKNNSFLNNVKRRTLRNLIKLTRTVNKKIERERFNRLLNLNTYNNLNIGCPSTASVPISLAASAMNISAIAHAGNAI